MSRHTEDDSGTTTLGSLMAWLASLRGVLVQPWAAWTLFGGAVGVYGLLILAEVRGHEFRLLDSEFWIFLSCVVGVSLGRGDSDRRRAPMSFLLPGYRETWRRLSFSRAVRWGVMWSLWLFSFSWSRLLSFWRAQGMYSGWPGGVPPDTYVPARPDNFEMALIAVNGLLGGAAVLLFWTNVGLVRLRHKWLVVPFWGFGVALFLMFACSAPVQHPFVVTLILIPASVFFCAYFWVRLGDMEWVRSGHRAIVVGDMEQPRAIAVRAKSRPRTEKLYLDRMRQGGVDAIGRHVWGRLYLAYGSIPLYWRWIAGAVLVLVVAQGYLYRPLVRVGFIVVGTMVAGSTLPAPSNLLLPEGRRRGYHLTLGAAVLTTLSLLATSALALAFSQVLAALLPPIPWGTDRWAYAAIPMSSLLLACVPVPWVFFAHLVWHRIPILPMAILLVVAFLAMGEISARPEGFYNGPSLLPGLLAAGWALFLLALHFAYRRWDLVSHNSTGA